VRNGTKAFVSIVSLGVIAAGYQTGLAAEVQNGFSATAPVVDQNPVVVPETQTSAATPTDAVSPASTPATSNEAAPTVVTSPAPVSTTAAAPASTPKPKTSTAPAPAPVVAPEPVTNAAGTTKNGTAIQYRFGTVQVAVTKSGGKITAVNLLQEGATGGRQAAFTYLVDLAIQANGTSFGNLSGATYTVDAFKQSLESALAKF
jgi:uncharacterized protein with FMN-binding domain